MTDPTFHTTAQGVAIDGYDPVAYFAEGGATKGSSEHSHEWSGATWHFASAENAASFTADPEKYAPQFGGQCSFGASLGKEAEASPTAWRIIDGKLYLMKDGAVRMLSKLFTGKIKKAAAAR